MAIFSVILAEFLKSSIQWVAIELAHSIPRTGRAAIGYSLQGTSLAEYLVGIGAASERGRRTFDLISGFADRICRWC
jgi:hypothetical protein